MSDFGKKRVFLIGLILLIGVLGIANNLLNNKRALNTSSDYVQFETNEMNLHEGEVLVDSNNVSESPAVITSAVTKPSDKDSNNKDTTQKDQNNKDTNNTNKTNNTNNNSNTTSKNDYFATARSTINMDRNQVLSMLTEVIEENPNVTEKNKAVEQKLKLIDYMNKEKVVENLLNNKGYKEVLVIMTDNSVNVTVKTTELNQSDIAQILDVVTRETGRPIDQTIIQSKY